jgi:hypothetical protein
MSTSMTGQQMVDEVQRRVALGWSDAIILARLNEAHKWLAQQAPWVWLLRSATVTVTTTGSFVFPTGFDPGKSAIVLWNGVEIPYKPWDVASRHQAYTTTTTSPLVEPLYSLFTVSASVAVNGNVSYVGQMYPIVTTTATQPVNLIYHTMVLTAVTLTDRFPVPDPFDLLLIERVEYEVRRVAGLGGLAECMANMKGSLEQLLDAYRTTKPTMMGILDQQRQTAEMEVAKAE